MPSDAYTKQVVAPIEELWETVSDLNNWATLMPGYVEHEVISESQGKLVFLGDFGIVKKNVTLQIEGIQRDVPETISFKLIGVGEGVNGSGSYTLEKVSEGSTNVTCQFEMSGSGFMGAMINNILKNFVPQVTKQLVEGINDKVVS
mgnify:FL=1